MTVCINLPSTFVEKGLRLDKHTGMSQCRLLAQLHSYKAPSAAAQDGVDGVDRLPTGHTFFACVVRSQRAHSDTQPPNHPVKSCLNHKTRPTALRSVSDTQNPQQPCDTPWKACTLWQDRH